MTATTLTLLAISFSLHAQSLTGMWESEDELVEFTEAGFFHIYSADLEHAYGTYKVENNALLLHLWPNAKGNITVPVEFEMELSGFMDKTQFHLKVKGTVEAPGKYVYRGPHSLTASDIAMLQSMSMTFHRVNMEIIDGMDGVDDYYYKQKNGW